MKQQEQAGGGTPQLIRNDAQQRYELRMGDEVAAKAEYREQEGGVCFTHTEVDERYEGQGLASKLAAFALDDVKSRGMKALPQCEFIAAYIARHEKDYGDLVAR